jgi:hypothetical protein
VRKFPEVDELPVIACSLGADQLSERRERWHALLEGSLLERAPIAAGVRLSLAAGPGVEAELRVLAALERECCGFAAFDVAAAPGGLTLEVTSQGDGVTAVRELFL